MLSQWGTSLKSESLCSASIINHPEADQGTLFFIQILWLHHIPSQRILRFHKRKSCSYLQSPAIMSIVCGWWGIEDVWSAVDNTASLCCIYILDSHFYLVLLRHLTTSRSCYEHELSIISKSSFDRYNLLLMFVFVIGFNCEAQEVRFPKRY